MSLALFCLLVNTSLLQNVPTMVAYSPSLTSLPELTGSALLSNGAEGALFNMSFLGRSSQTYLQPFSIVKTSYQQDSWSQTILPVPPTSASSSAGLRWTQDPLGNMWLLLVNRGSAGTAGATNLLYLPAGSSDVVTVYNGTQYQLLDIQISLEGMFLLASFAGSSPVSLLTYGIVGMNPPLGFLTNFPWLPGTQRAQAIQTFFVSPNGLFLVGNTGALETWLKNATTNTWVLSKSTALSANGAVLKLSEGVVRNSLFCITAKLLLQVVFAADGSVTQTIVQSLLVSSPMVFRSIGLGVLGATPTLSPFPTQSSFPTRSSLPSRRSTETVSQGPTPSALSQETAVFTQSSFSTQSSLPSRRSTETASQDPTPSAGNQEATVSATQDPTSTATTLFSQGPTPSAGNQGATVSATQDATATGWFSQSPSACISQDPTPSVPQRNQTIPSSLGSSDSYIMPLTVSLGVVSVAAAGIVVLNKKLFLKKVFTKQPAPKKVYQSVELARNPDLILLTFEPQNWETQSVKFHKPVKLAFQPNVVPM